MHSVVQIDEIFLNILSWVAPASLLDLGLSCRAFYEPAMDARWFRLDSFVPLLKCLPSDSIVAVYDKRTRQKCHITVRRLKPEDWTRFEAHARRVKEYTIRASGHGTPRALGLSEAMSSAIAEHFRDRPVLPHLQKFENNIIGWRDDIKLLLRCPIHTIRLDHAHDPELYGTALTSELGFVRRVATVESLSMGSQLPIGRQLSLLADMPNLTYLAIMVDDQHRSTSWISDLATLPANSFPKLRTLQLNSISTEWYRDVLQTVSTLEIFLRTIKLHMSFSQLIVKFHKSLSDPDIHADELRKLCSYIARDCPALESLEIDTLYTLVVPSVVSPLCALRNLHTLRLTWLMIDPRPGTIEYFASSWPKLTELQWGTRYESNQEAPTTVATLRTILDGFPRLEVLGMQLDFTSTPARRALEELPLEEVVQHRSLRSLSLGKSYVPEDAIERLAISLAHMVPAAQVTLLNATGLSESNPVSQEGILHKILLRMRELAQA